MFVPDYSEIENMLLPDGINHVNDLALSKCAQSSELAELYASRNGRYTDNDAPSLIDYDAVDDSTLFDCCLDKSIQDPEEFQASFKEFRL